MGLAEEDWAKSMGLAKQGKHDSCNKAVEFITTFCCPHWFCLSCDTTKSINVYLLSICATRKKNNGSTNETSGSVCFHPNKWSAVKCEYVGVNQSLCNMSSCTAWTCLIYYFFTGLYFLVFILRTVGKHCHSFLVMNSEPLWFFPSEQWENLFVLLWAGFGGQSTLE